MTIMDGPVVRAWAELAEAVARRRADLVDALNVFPVPDRDTGTNVSLTLAAGAAALRATDPSGDAHRVAADWARGAALGARGNSGMILAGWLGGLATRLPASPTPPQLAEALGAAAQAARDAVLEPQRGTVLTVARQVAVSAATRAADGADLAELVTWAVAEARADLAATSTGHPVLRAAGVVDAGACALLLLLECLPAVLTGGDPRSLGDWLEQVSPGGPTGRTKPDGPTVEPDGPEVELVVSVHGPGELLRTSLAAVGDSVTVALTGHEDATAVDPRVAAAAGPGWQGHVHTAEAGAALSALLGIPGLRIRQALVQRVSGARLPLVVVTTSPSIAGLAAGRAAVAVLATGLPDQAEIDRARADAASGAGVGPDEIEVVRTDVEEVVVGLCRELDRAASAARP